MGNHPPLMLLFFPVSTNYQQNNYSDCYGFYCVLPFCWWSFSAPFGICIRPRVQYQYTHSLQQIPAILFTPICPHSLSFRPMILPENSEIRLQVPLDSRSSVMAHFDGRVKLELQRGDAVKIKLSKWYQPPTNNNNNNR